MRIDVEDIIKLERERSKINRPDIRDIEFYSDGKPVDISEDERKDWLYIGLSNIDFIMNRDWPE